MLVFLLLNKGDLLQEEEEQDLKKVQILMKTIEEKIFSQELLDWYLNRQKNNNNLYCTLALQWSFPMMDLTSNDWNKH